jgi:O-methyltransferase domain/Dimerisation domain
MLQMIQGFWVSRAIYLAAKLGIPDLLKGGPQSSQDLALASGTHAPSLYRLLRALDSVGVFAEDSEGRFTLTALGATLRSDVPGSLRFFAIEELGENHYPAWEKVLHSVQTGAIAFDHVYGESKWRYMEQHPEEAMIFDRAMASFSEVVAAAVAAGYDFASSRTVVDLGGGDGSLLAGILRVHSHLRGVVADVPHVVERARRRLEADGLSQRCGTAAMDFFKGVPTSDTYVLKWILHDWTDEQCATILKNCRNAMTADGRVLIIEAVLQPGAATSFGKFVDLNMLVMTGGRERTEAEYRTLLDAGGLKLARVVPTQTEMSIIEATRA